VKIGAKSIYFRNNSGKFRTRKVINSLKNCLKIFEDDLYLIDIDKNITMKNFVYSDSVGDLRLCGQSKFGGLDEDDSDDEFSQTVTPEDPSNKSSFTILSSNVSGGLGNSMCLDKKQAIKAMSINDTFLFLSETNCVADDTPMLVRCLGVDGRIESLENWTYDKAGKRVEPKGGKKISAYGSAIICRYLDICEWPEVDMVGDYDFEILPVVVRFGQTCGLQITGYRSPSMRDEAEIAGFYETINKVIEDCKEKHKLDYIIYAMDDNKCSSEVARLNMEKVLSSHNLMNLIGKY